MNRKVLCILVLAALFLPTLACNRGSNSSSAPASAVETAQKLAKNTVPATVPSPDPKTLITDDKIGRYAIYQKEMNSVIALVLGAAGQAFAKSGGNQQSFEKELSGDERTKKIMDAQTSAISKSGLTQMEATEISKIVSTYTPGATMGDDEMKKKAREEFSAKYGPEVLAVLEKHLPELSKLQDEMLEAAFSKKK